MNLLDENDGAGSSHIGFVDPSQNDCHSASHYIAVLSIKVGAMTGGMAPSLNNITGEEKKMLPLLSLGAVFTVRKSGCHV